MINFCLYIRYKRNHDKKIIKDCLLYNSLSDLKNDLNDFKKLTDIISYKIYSCNEIDEETRELIN